MQDHDDDKHPEGCQQQDNTNECSVEDVRGYDLSNPIGVGSYSLHHAEPRWAMKPA
jgi:hypothetical protein